MADAEDDFKAAADGAADDFDESDVGEDDLDEELMLPDVLRSISFDEKKELLHFKRSHNEIEWEQEVLRRQDLLARKIDMERLKRMSRGAVEKDTKKKKGTASEKRKTGAKRKRGGKDSSDDEDSEELAAGDEDDTDDDVEDFAALRTSTRSQHIPASDASANKKLTATKKARIEEAGAASDDVGAADDTDDGAADDFDDEDDLFNSDEEEAITKGATAVPAHDEESGEEELSLKQRGTKRSTRSSNRSRRRQKQVLSDEEYGDDGADDSEDYEDDDDDKGDDRSGYKGAKEKRDSKWDRARAEDDDDDLYGGGAMMGDTGSFSISSFKAAARRNRVKETVVTAEQQMELDDEDEVVIDDDGVPATRDDFLKVQARRDFIIKMLKEPHAQRALRGWFVRVPVGRLDINEEQVYRIAEITKLTTGGRRYTVPGSKEQLEARLCCNFLGKQILNNLKILYVSNSRFTEDEFRYYENALEKKGSQIMTKMQVAARRKRLIRNVQHTYTNEEVQQLVAKSIGLDKSTTTEYTTAMESLEKKLEAARAVARNAPSGDEVFNELEMIQKTMDKLKENYAQQKEIFDRAARKQLEVNRRMRESNVQRDIAAGMRKRHEEQEAAARGELSNKMVDPFIRRETRPKILWNTGKKLEEQRKANADAGDEEQDLTGKNDASSKAADVSGTGGDSLHTQQRKAQTSKTLQPAWRTIEDASVIDEIRKRIQKRMGADPCAIAAISKRERYLKKVCAGLPPLGSEERRLLHRKMVGDTYKSLDEVLDIIGMNHANEEGVESASFPMQLVE